VKDSIVRGRLLKLLHQRRNEDALPFGAAEGAVPPPPGIAERDWLHALAKLAEYHLVSWAPLVDPSGKGRMAGFAQINERGVDVVEGREFPEIEIRVC
jgi:hypothetical protein